MTVCVSSIPGTLALLRHETGQVDVPGDLGDSGAVSDEVRPVLHSQDRRGARDGEACSWICSTRMPAAFTITMGAS